jgi:hypothetical protein
MSIIQMGGGFELVWFDHLPAFVCDTDTTYCGPSASSICVVSLPACSLYIVQRRKYKLSPTDTKTTSNGTTAVRQLLVVFLYVYRSLTTFNEC